MRSKPFLRRGQPGLSVMLTVTIWCWRPPHDHYQRCSLVEDYDEVLGQMRQEHVWQLEKKGSGTG